MSIEKINKIASKGSSHFNSLHTTHYILIIDR